MRHLGSGLPNLSHTPQDEVNPVSSAVPQFEFAHVLLGCMNCHHKPVCDFRVRESLGKHWDDVSQARG